MPSPGRCSATSKGASVARTDESMRCHVGASGRLRSVVGGLRELVEVQPRRLAAELAGRARLDADRSAELVVLAQEVGVHAGVFVAKRLPLAPVGDRQAGERRRQVGVAHLERVARHDAHPGTAAQLDGRVPRHVVRRHDVRMHLVPDRHQPLVRVLLGRDQRLPDRLRHRLDLLDRRLAELRRGDADELGPGVLGSRAAVHLGCVDRAFGRQPPPPEPSGRDAPRSRAARARRRRTRR